MSETNLIALGAFGGALFFLGHALGVIEGATKARKKLNQSRDEACSQSLGKSILVKRSTILFAADELKLSGKTYAGNLLLQALKDSTANGGDSK